MAGLNDVRSALIGALQGVSGGGWYALSGRVRSGYAPFTIASGSGLVCNANTGSSGSGALIHVGAGACIDDDMEHANRYPQFEVRVDVWMAIPKDTSSNLSGIVTFADTVRAAMHNVLSRGGATYDAPEVFPDNLTAVYHYRYACRGYGCG
jgi:hypothetical protein